MENQKKILFFITNYFPYSNGEPYVEPEFEYLIKTFDEIFIYTLSENKTYHYTVPFNVKTENINVKIKLISKICAFRFLFNKIFWKELKFIKNKLHEKIDKRIIAIILIDILKAEDLKKRIIKKIKQKNFIKDKIYYYSFWNDFRAFAGLLIKNKFPQLKVFSRAHGWDVYFERNFKNYLPLKKIMAENMDAIYYVSEVGRKYSINKIGDYKSLKVSYLGKDNNNAISFPIKKQPFHLFVCCNFVAVKRLDLFIDAVAEINESYNIHFTHIGGGDGDEHELKEYIYKYVNIKLSDIKNISYKFSFKFFDNSEIMDFLKNEKPNLLINTSSSEGIPVSMMEAMSFGIPVIGTDVGGVSEIIENKYNGLLINADSTPQEIAKAIEYFYEMSNEDYAKYCSNAYQTWCTKFNAEINYQKFINDILSL